MKPTTYREALVWASSLLASINPKIAEWLQLHLMGVERQEWVRSLDDSMSSDALSRYQGWVKAVVDGEPYQYIVGEEDFYGRTFHVSPAVLIPRPETELLVEHVIAYAKRYWADAVSCTMVDIGTGSGAIAVTCALEWDKVRMLAVDISEEALSVASHNANQLGAQVEFLQGDLLQPLLSRKKKVDVLISNPPYIPFSQKEKLDRNVVDFEPHTALFAPEDGLYFYRQLIQQSPSILANQSLLAFEVGIHQAQAVVDFIKHIHPSAKCEVKRDYQGIDRMVLAYIEK
ncbi:peptide chain release factor N(5)-glutamine methyltransferase [Bacillus horti]|uniref:Release factor glutamine methyltransferase n=1 Tax=Caldalkalibacillus horti TaxID=77523 RepID=A0ABT9VVY9_9BACI|nr:peptide chain release factor N(5)-glutamine methyltransferase [Bacillus horti]MDQ0165138.1 release factor glutamine methyltransferase [Bacillus horti]